MPRLEARHLGAVQSYWIARHQQREKHIQGERIDAGTRGAVTGGTQMGALDVLIADLLEEAGLERLQIKTKPRGARRNQRQRTEARSAVNLPGYYRAEKEWDLLVIAENQLVAVIEFKSQVGPSFGNNLNNRVEEAVGSASDLWTAYRDGRIGFHRPFLGYFFLLEDCPKVHRPVRVTEPYFPVDPVFRGASSSERYAVMCRRLMLERLYDAACLILSTNAVPTQIRTPSEELGFPRFAAKLQGHVHGFIRTRT